MSVGKASVSLPYLEDNDKISSVNYIFMFRILKKCRKKLVRFKFKKGWFSTFGSLDVQNSSYDSGHAVKNSMCPNLKKLCCVLLSLFVLDSNCVAKRSFSTKVNGNLTARARVFRGRKYCLTQCSSILRKLEVDT